MKNEKMSLETCLLHTPYERPDVHHALSMPIYNAVAYEFDTAEAMADAFCERSKAHSYSRVSNPTVQYFEDKVGAVTGALSVTAVNSGMAAISHTLLTVASAGANIVSSPYLFGSTYSLLNNTFTRLGIEVRFCDLTDLEAVRSVIDRHTCALYSEVITNPQMEVADLKALAAIAQEARVPLIADTTLVPFTHFKARDFGVDIEVVSSTKYISGGATSLGGLIIDYGTFDWSGFGAMEKWCGSDRKAAFSACLRKEVHRNIGAYMTPYVAGVQSLGLETLPIRFERQASTCLELAKRLGQLKGIVSVNYTGLESNRFYPLSNKQFGRLPGAMLTFDLASREACFSFINRLKTIRRATNLFDNKSLILHPASTIYGTFTDEQRTQMKIKQQTVRLSVGLEPVDDLLEDIEQALSAPL